MTIIKTYSELITIPTFEERFDYLKLDGVVGQSTFGYDRYLNQVLYNSHEWRKFRRDMIIRDQGRDLACEGFDLMNLIVAHHINPITVEDVINRHPKVFDPENIICCSDRTHRALHYGDKSLLLIAPIVRLPNDTCPWKK